MSILYLNIALVLLCRFVQCVFLCILVSCSRSSYNSGQISTLFDLLLGVAVTSTLQHLIVSLKDLEFNKGRYHPDSKFKNLLLFFDILTAISIVLIVIGVYYLIFAKGVES